MTEVYVLRIDAIDPKAITLARLAKYLDRFAKILGHEEGVHLDEIRSGRTNIVCRIDPNHAKVVSESLQALVGGQGAKVSRSAYGSMMKMLAKDKAKAMIFEGDDIRR
ncbi:hypothetical protein [Thioalkalivibrio sp. HK1]|uniref:hypothetical protein n=1 Tax=Thioalkalivibrio sp. HK1 TaxID=1469245 RepID=UPI0012DC89FC|nr:hypothetical protein [Thioalkalivibrio sp. HK1]